MGGGGKLASSSMQAHGLSSMLLPALVVDGPVVASRELPNKIQALRMLSTPRALYVVP